jgi:nicotinamidase-related amidase/type 1 glutamine amidotransferase
MPKALFPTGVLLLVLGSVFSSGFPASAAEPDAKNQGDAGQLSLVLRSRLPGGNDSGLSHLTYRPETWEAQKTAVIVCDMWDTHHSENAANRTGELAPRMNKVLIEARRRGATIIHAPSNCMATYENHPARKHVAEVPRSKNFPQDIGKWCYQIPSEEQGKYPLDQTDADDDDRDRLKVFHEELAARGRNPKHPWVSQIDTLTIKNEDYISDNGEEIWSILEHHGIENVILVGVHTNMCVLGRPFGLRQMAKNGKNVVLMRDMTDTMYNPQKSPFVSHFTGTDLIVEHIEKYVCPTVTSDQVLGGEPFRFEGDKRKRLVMIISEPEYETEKSLPVFALKHLGHEFSVDYVFADAKDQNKLAGLELIDDADALLISVRRRALPAEQLSAIRRFVEAGKPVVALRTASHAFALRNNEPPSGRVLWPEFDNDILGGNYHNHHGSGPKTQIELAEGAKDHPILKDVDVNKLVGNGSLYVTKPLAESATPLLIGSVPGKDSEPIAWTNRPATGNRVFYTSLGHIEDFKNPEFQKLLKNAIVWATYGEREKSTRVW